MMNREFPLVYRVIIILIADFLFLFSILDSAPSFFGIKNYCDTYNILSCYNSMIYLAYFLSVTIKVLDFLLLTKEWGHTIIAVLVVTLSLSPFGFFIIFQRL